MGPLSVELVRPSCGHYIPRPPGWRHGAVHVNPLGIQQAMEEYARELGTPYFEEAAVQLP